MFSNLENILSNSTAQKKSPNYHLSTYLLTEMGKFYSSSFHMNLRAHSCFFYFFYPISARVNVWYMQGASNLTCISSLAACALALDTWSHVSVNYPHVPFNRNLTLYVWPQCYFLYF